MAETYWEQAARGAMPQNGGWNSVVNPLANTGQPIDLNALMPQQRSSQMGPAWDAAAAANVQRRAANTALTNRQKVVQQARDAQLAQQAATKSRLDEAIAGYKERRTTAAKSFAGAGQSAADDINRHYDSLIARTRQQFNSSGLGQTTMPATTVSGIERDRAAALSAAGIQVAGQATGADLQASGDYLNFLGNIQDNFDPSQLVDLSRAEGAATQNQLDASAFGGNFFPGAAGYGAQIGGTGYGGLAQSGYGGYDYGAIDPSYAQQGQGNWYGAQQQQPVMSQADKNRQASYAATRAAQPFQQLRTAMGSAALQQQAQARLAAGNHFQNADYGPDAALYGR